MTKLMTPISVVCFCIAVMVTGLPCGQACDQMAKRSICHDFLLCKTDERGPTITCIYDKIAYSFFRINFYLNQTTGSHTIANQCPECITETAIEGLDRGVMYTFDFSKAGENLTGVHNFTAAYSLEAISSGSQVIQMCCNRTEQIQYQTEITVEGGCYKSTLSSLLKTWTDILLDAAEEGLVAT